ncbi:MAG: polyhydroxyalkanoic acid system family protein [Woeseiaceae bacterium]|nr:polyhydroxyalkanoic acid system family protein [Woeseiaceae bacterium]
MKIRRAHTLGTDEVKARVDRIAARLGQQFTLSSRWSGDDLEFRGSGVSGTIRVEDDSVEVDVRLGLALMMMEGPIRRAVEDAMDSELA